MFSLEFKNIDEFEIFQIPCDEEIQKKNIKNFISTNLKLQTTIAKDCIYFYNYCEVLKLYQIYKTKKTYLSTVIFEPLLFGLLFESGDIHTQKNYLFESEKYFVLYLSGLFQFVYIKDMATTKDTVVEYLKQQNIGIANIIFIKTQEINKLKNRYKNSLKKQKLSFVKYTQTYLIYPTIVGIVLMAYLVKDDAIQEVKQQLNITPTIKAIIQNEVLIDNKWYQKDDIYQGYKLQQVNKNNVVFLINDKHIVVNIIYVDR